MLFFLLPTSLLSGCSCRVASRCRCFSFFALVQTFFISSTGSAQSSPRVQGSIGPAEVVLQNGAFTKQDANLSALLAEAEPGSRVSLRGRGCEFSSGSLGVVWGIHVHPHWRWLPIGEVLPIQTLLRLLDSHGFARCG